MTCIVAIKQTNNKILMVGDRRVTAGTWISQSPRPKIFKFKNILFGLAGRAELNDLIHFNLEKYIKQSLGNSFLTLGDVTPIVFIYDILLPNLVQLLTDYNYLTDLRDLKPNVGNSRLLVGIQDHLFIVGFEADHPPTTHQVSFPYIIGSGDAIEGMLHYFRRCCKKPITRKVLVQMLQITSQLNNTCHPTEFDSIEQE